MMHTPEPMNQGHPAHALPRTQPSAASLSVDPGDLSDILQESNNIAVWERNLSSDLQREVENLLACKKALQLAFEVTSENCRIETEDALRKFGDTTTLSNDIAQLVDMFCYLFDLKHAGLRLTTLDRAMCPRFHVDRVPCRLVTTYQGCSTQWLPHQLIDRTKLGTGSNGLPDEHSGLYTNAEDVQQLTPGDVALLKGELWSDRQNFGLVHRSPTPEPGEKRLLLTLDFLS